MMKRRLVAFAIALGLTANPVAAEITAGITAIEEGRFQEAVDHLQSDLKSSETAFEAHWRTGQAYVSMGKPKEALEFLEVATEMQPGHAEALYWWGAANGEVAGQASVFSAPGYAKACRRAFEQVLVLDPAHIKARSGLVEYLIAAPGFLGGDKDRALQEAEKLKQLDKAKGFSSLANVYMAKEQPQKALEVYNEAVSEFPNALGARFGRGILQRQIKNYDGALSDFHTLINVNVETQENPKEAYVMRGLGQYFFGAVSSKSGLRVAEGIQVLEAYLEAGEFDVPLREGYGQYYLAKLYLGSGDVEKAKILAKAAGKNHKDKDLKKLLTKLSKKLKKA